MGYYIDSNAFSKSITDGLFIPRVIGVKYDKGSAILFNKAIYFANKITQWTGELNEDWDPYISAGGNNQIFDFKGIVDLISDLPTSSTDGDYMFVKENKHTYFYYNNNWQDAGEIVVGEIDSVTESDLNELKTYVDNQDLNSINILKEYVDEKTKKKIYDSEVVYKKDDIITLTPELYDSITYPAGTYKTHIGQSIRYNDSTTARRFDVEVRARVDSAKDPLTNPGDWYPVNTRQVIEQGKNAIGEYVLYADGTSECYMSVYVAASSKNTWSQSQRKPIYTVSYRYAFVSQSSGTGSFYAITSIDSAGDTIIVTAYELNGAASSFSGTVRIVSNDVWYWLN